MAYGLWPMAYGLWPMACVPPPIAHRPFGPNVDQVNHALIRPVTADFAELPGSSWSVMENLKTGGLLCTAFFSHAWDEGIFEFCRNALAAWPDDCEGAYICFLSNPQNLDIDKIVGHEVEESPFYTVLSSRPRAVILLANCNVPIHTRYWCVLEAFLAFKFGIERVEIAGESALFFLFEESVVKRGV